MSIRKINQIDTDYFKDLFLTRHFALSFLSEESKRFICEKCGFETNSEEIFRVYKKNCPKV